MTVPVIPTTAMTSPSPPTSTTDTARHADPSRASFYRAASGTRPSGTLSEGEAQNNEVQATTVALLNANPDFALPDTTRFRDYPYKVGFKPDYIAQPEVGYATGNQYGLSGFNGGTTIVLSDLLGTDPIAFSPAG